MPSILTIGHSNHPLERFLALLAQHGVDVVVDVRSAPYSRYAQHFNKDLLEAGVTNAGHRYLYMGTELGGRPEGDEFYDEDDHVRYAAVAQAPWFLHGIDRLERGITRFRVALVCAEEDPTGCHRRLLVGRVLGSRGVEVAHIRGDGRLESEASLAARESSAQLGLFEGEDVRPWRSIRSVSRRRPPSGSSDA
ncbi:MAG: DUF488 domain-containing protein [Chloroflexi bacterium]|nr:DUF488 domain-containing protein [Chloroflexota bacterium]